jgi:hypothetical protein
MEKHIERFHSLFSADEARGKALFRTIFESDAFPEILSKTRDFPAATLYLFLEGLDRPSPSSQALVDLIALNQKDDQPPMSPRMSLDSKIIGLLTLKQLDNLADVVPSLLLERSFLRAYLQRLQPSPDDAFSDRTLPEDVMENYLKRLWDFSSKLSNIFARLKITILQNYLILLSERSEYDLDLFTRYAPLFYPYHQ